MNHLNEAIKQVQAVERIYTNLGSWNSQRRIDLAIVHALIALVEAIQDRPRLSKENHEIEAQ